MSSSDTSDRWARRCNAGPWAQRLHSPAPICAIRKGIRLPGKTACFFLSISLAFFLLPSDTLPLKQISCCCELEEGVQYRFSGEKRTLRSRFRYTLTGNLL